jgi:teichuronic acid biosynthesis glycosyltransferase TuaG
MGEKLYQQGLVSIVTPVFNAERYIEQTILSVLGQSYQNWELLLIDDCSRDHSAEIIKNYTEKDPRIKYHRLKENSGAAVARNAAINFAKGEYLAFLDSDDLWMTDKLKRQLAYMNEKACAFSFTHINIIDSDNNIVKAIVPIPLLANYKYLLKHTVIATSTVLLNRSKLPSFTMPSRRGGQDYATWLQLLRNVDYAYGLDDCLTSYRVSSHSLSSNKFSSIQQVYEIQTQNEHINKLRAIVNTVCFCIYTFKKHYL